MKRGNCGFQACSPDLITSIFLPRSIIVCKKTAVLWIVARGGSLADENRSNSFVDDSVDHQPSQLGKSSFYINKDMIYYSWSLFWLVYKGYGQQKSVCLSAQNKKIKKLKILYLRLQIQVEISKHLSNWNQGTTYTTGNRRSMAPEPNSTQRTENPLVVERYISLSNRYHEKWTAY